MEVTKIPQEHIRTNVPYEYRCKNFQGNNSKLNPPTYKKIIHHVYLYTIISHHPSGIYQRNASWVDIQK